jgi:hypothetical protein
MNRTILLLLACILPMTIAFGQTPDDNISAPCKSRFGITITPLFMQLDRINEDGDPFTDTIIDLIDDGEESALGYALGLGFRFPISNTWSIDAGIQYAQKTRIIETAGIFWPDKPGGNPEVLKAINRYNTHHIDIPLGVAAQFGKQKWSWIVGLGGTASLFLNEILVQEIKLNNGTEERTATTLDTDYNSLNFSLYARAGIKYAMNDRMHLEVTPVVQYGLTRIIDTQPISARMNHMGVQVGWYTCL